MLWEIAIAIWFAYEFYYNVLEATPSPLFRWIQKKIGDC